MDQGAMPFALRLSLIGGLIGGGVLLGWLGSYFAARRFIQNVELH
jgi:cell division transport system permease protein